MQTHRLALASLPAGLVLAFVACSVPDKPSWRDQLQADSPCYDVNLLDGLDESSTAELRDLYDCVNASRNFDSLQASIDGLERPSRDGVPAGVEVARTVNAMSAVDIDPFALAGVALDLLRADDRPIEEFLDVGLELIYGIPSFRVRAGQIDLTAPSALERGVLSPAAPVLGVAATAMLDDDLEMAKFTGELLGDPETKRWIRTFGSYVASSDARVRDPVKELPGELGQLVVATRDGANDHYPGTSGDSLRDLADVFAGDDPLLDDVSDEADAMLGDIVVRTQLETRLVGWHRDGRLDTLAEQVAWMASVDVDGASLDRGEVSGLHALIRLLHDTNRPMRCSLDLWVTDLEIDLGNLAVTILKLLADQNPDTVQTGVGILGTIIDWGLSEAVMNEIADSGVCPTLTRQVVHDLRSIDLIYDDRVYDLLVVFIDALNLLENGQTDHIPDLADLSGELYAGGGLEPVEELIRDVAAEPAIDHVIDLVPVLADPDAYGIEAGEDDAVDLHDALSIATWLFEPGDGGETGWERVQPLVTPVLAEDATWTVVGNAATLAATDDTQTCRALELIPPLLAADPELATLDALGPLLGDETLAMPLLRAIETEGVPQGLLASAPQGSDPEVPLAFVARLVTDGTLDEALAMVDLLVNALSDLLPEE